MSKLIPHIDVNLYKLTAEQKNGGSRCDARPPVSLQQVEKEFNTFEHIDITSESHMQSLTELFPSYLLEQRDDTDWELFLAMSRYDRRNKTFVTGCFDNESVLDFKLISFKHRYKDGIKWKTRAGTSPNGIPFVRIYSDGGVIYVVEGHRDALTAVLLGLDYIMIPYAGFKLIDPLYLQSEVRERKLVFLIEDIQAYRCMQEVASKLSGTAKAIHMTDFTPDDTKLDLSDFVCKFNTIKEVMDGLQSLG